MATDKKTLVIVESPAKAKTIEKYLGAGFEVVASVGHVRDLPKSNKKAIDIEGGFVPHYEISKGKEKIVSEIARLAKKSKEVLLATDPDREGEAIAWHVAIATGLDPDKTKRVVFHEITKSAVEEAILHPRPIDENLRRAQEARRVLDRLVGYDLSGLIWKKVRYGLSAGRVQSPALRIIMEREREIRAFKPETFWTITADTETKQKTKLLFTCSEEPREEKEMKRIVAAGEKNPWHIVDVKETEAKRSPYAPFTTSTLQQTASSRLGFSPSRTMSVAQRLYEAGLITYMRTDSVNLSDFALGAAANTITKMYGEEFLTVRKYTTKSKNAQEAHEAIRPTDVSKMKAGHSPEQQKLYALIWQRTLASQMADAKILRTRVTANIKVGETGTGERVVGAKRTSESDSVSVTTGSFPKIVFSLGASVRNSNSENSASIFLRSIFSAKVFWGSEKSIGASGRIVANIFENSASSSPDFKSSTILGVIFALRNFSSPFFNSAFIFSIVPKFEMRIVAVFSPMPFIPGILSDGSPLKPL